MTQLFTLQINGFYREEFISSLTGQPGVYFVFLGRKTTNGCSIKKCIYIGKAEKQGIRNRLTYHEKMPRFQQCAKEADDGSILYFAFAECPIENVPEIESALIKHFNPLINSECTESFTSSYERITIILQGKIPIIFANDMTFSVEPEAKETK